jgi:hypothetical protein
MIAGTATVRWLAIAMETATVIRQTGTATMCETAKTKTAKTRTAITTEITITTGVS